MNNKTRQQNISKALKAFPKVVKQKERAYKKRQAFVERTFGKLARQLDKRVRRRRPSGS